MVSSLKRGEVGEPTLEPSLAERAFGLRRQARTREGALADSDHFGRSSPSSVARRVCRRSPKPHWARRRLKIPMRIQQWRSRRPRTGAASSDSAQSRWWDCSCRSGVGALSSACQDPLRVRKWRVRKGRSTGVPAHSGDDLNATSRMARPRWAGGAPAGEDARGPNTPPGRRSETQHVGRSA
jgi:hypothetical protein